MKRRPSKLKRGPVGHASAEQKEKLAREGGSRIPISHTLIEGFFEGDLYGGPTEGLFLDPAHIVPRPHGGCDHEDCVIPLLRFQHEAYDRGELDVLPYLRLEEQAHAASHLGILGALKRTTGENYIPEREA